MEAIQFSKEYSYAYKKAKEVKTTVNEYVCMSY
jgi:hypothetical protein